MEITYSKEALVVQSNTIIRAQKDNLTILETKLIYLAISQIVMGDTELNTYTCAAAELADYLEITPEAIYKEVDKLTDSILTKRIKLVDKSRPPKRNGEYNWRKFQWVSYCSYENGIITIRINDALKPYLLGLHAFFTEYCYYDNIRLLPSSTAINLFQLLASYEYLTNPYNPNPPVNPYPHIAKEPYELIFSIDFLREYFNCIDKYPSNGDFIKWIIDSSVAAINKKSAMRVSYRTAKEGRKIAYVLFKINAWEDKEFMDFIKSSL